MPIGHPSTQTVNTGRLASRERDCLRVKRTAAADSVPRYSNTINRHRSRSTDSQYNEECETGGLVAGRKRKLGLMEGNSRALTSTSQTRTIHIGKQRKHKVARYGPPVLSDATDNGQSQPASRRHSLHIASSTDEDSSIMSAMQLQRRRRSLNRSVSTQPPGSHGTMEFESMRKEILKLQKADLSRKAAVDQAQAVEELKRELSAFKKMNRKQGHQIEKLKASSKKSEDLLNVVQGSLQCQICLEMFIKPFALSPCGHVLCQKCLQEWFRSAPRQPGEDDIDNIPTIYRIKTCPCCRTRINTRPVPLFVIKNLVSAFATEIHESHTDTTLDDPWQDIFLLDGVSSDEDQDDEDGDVYDSDADSASSIDTRYLGLRIFSDDGDDDDDDQGSESEVNMVLPAWAPAFYRATVTRRIHPLVSQEHFQLLQRGATQLMIERWGMRLDSEDGIVAWFENGTEVYLGWNIALPEDDHPDGRLFMAWVEDSMMDDPEGWLCEGRHGSRVYRRLVPEDMETEILSPDGGPDDDM
ncbi:hypothetical protein M0805_003609 [Coniferiporia weirii]|nr:hypothetical protein M0805_003609 [Coniferiporia weirii]